MNVVALLVALLPAFAEPVVGPAGVKFVRIPAGEFQMGGHESADALAQAFAEYKRPASYFADEYPRHRVRITRAFEMGMHEVTVGQFKRFVEKTGFKTEAETDGKGGWGYNSATGKCEGRKPQYTWREVGFAQTDDHPVLNVSWNDAVAFCKWLGSVDGRTCRLPTEAEWEYACRAGWNARYSFGDDPAHLTRHARAVDAPPAGFAHVQDLVIPAGTGKFTAPVGSLPANGFGLHDMHGNVWEWCSDWYDENAYARSPVDDPKGPPDGKVRIRRGGAWNSFPLWARAAFRNWNVPASRCVNLGFRVVRELPPAD